MATCYNGNYLSLPKRFSLNHIVLNMDKLNGLEQCFLFDVKCMNVMIWCKIYICDDLV